MDYSWFDSGCYTPEELIIAAGLTPRRILPSPDESTVEADKWIQATHCSLARSVLNNAITGKYAGQAGVLLTHGCDVTSREYDIWKEHADVKDLYYLNVPLKIDKTAEKFFLKEMKRFKAHLEEIVGHTITDEDLNNAIDICNETRSLLRELDLLRATNPPKFKSSEFFELVKLAQVEDKKVANVKLKDALETFKTAHGEPNKHPRIVLTGTIIDTVDLIKTIENAGLDIVGDDLDIGGDYFSFDIKKTGKPLKDITRAYLNKPANATKHPPDQRLDILVKMSKDRNADGLIYQSVKFCEPYLYDSVFITNHFKQEEELPVLLFEREYTLQGMGQIQTRIEAFKEML